MNVDSYSMRHTNRESSMLISRNNDTTTTFKKYVEAPSAARRHFQHFKRSPMCKTSKYERVILVRE